MNLFVVVPSALRDLYETMDKTSSSLPPIILLQFLHMAFPQFAEKGDQGQYLQQVRELFTQVTVTETVKPCLVSCTYVLYLVLSGCQRVLAANDESASAKVGATRARNSHGGKT